jgi:hypothetical protein
MLPHTLLAESMIAQRYADDHRRRLTCLPYNRSQTGGRYGVVL